MKKIFNISVLCILFFVQSAAFAYTSTDVSNASFLADENLIVKQSSSVGYRLDDSITRAEVVGIALKMKWVQLPAKYTCKNYYSDVAYNAMNNWVCRAVELAADEGLVTRANTKFRPNDKITRAEALAIIVKSGGIIYPTNIRITRDDQKNLPPWTVDLLAWISGKWITDLSWYWFDNTSGYGDPFALRNEVFQFALGVYTYNYLPKTIFTNKNSSSVLPAKLDCVNSGNDLAPGESLCSSVEYEKNNSSYQSFILNIQNKEFEKAAIIGHTLWSYYFGFWDALNEIVYSVKDNTLFALWLSPQSWWTAYIVTYTLRGDKIIRQSFFASDQDYKNWEYAIKQEFWLQESQDIYSLIADNGMIRDDVMKFAEQYWVDLFMNSTIESQ